MKRVLSAFCCLALTAVPALAQKKAAAAAPAMTNQQFVDFAAQTDMVEVDLGQLAQDVAALQLVKDYGQMLVTDHTNDFAQLHVAAQQANLTVPGGIDAENVKTTIAPFHKLKGEAFDHRYIHEMVVGHTKAIEIYKKEAADAQNPAVKSYAEAALPVLQKHLEHAKALQK